MISIGKIIIGIGILVIVLGLLPIFIGAVVSSHMKREDAKTISFSYFMGLMLMLMVMQLLSVPMTLMRVPFSTLTISYTVILLVFCAVALVFHKDYLKQIGAHAKGILRNLERKWFFVVAVIMIPVVVLAFTTPYIYGDDRTYITMVNDILESNALYQTDFVTGESAPWVLSKYSLSSYWTWIAYLAKVSGLHPLILCKTVLMFFFVPMSYWAQGLLASYLFHNSERRIYLYMAFAGLIGLFGEFSMYSVSYRLYTWVWQSKAFLAIIVLPFLFYYCNLIFEKQVKVFEYVVLFLLVIATASTTLTGTGLAVAMIMVLALIYAVRNRKFSLLVGAGISCTPAFVFALMHLKYTEFLQLLNF